MVNGGMGQHGYNDSNTQGYDGSTRRGQTPRRTSAPSRSLSTTSCPTQEPRRGSPGGDKLLGRGREGRDEVGKGKQTHHHHDGVRRRVPFGADGALSD
jgi:hypothetical protein